MKLFHTTTVNWGHLPISDVNFGDVTLMGGESGSGKSTLIDAMIAVMTGDERRFARYNPGQGEVTSSKKSKRTLAAYVLGVDDSGPPHRPHGAHGYAAMHFQPDERDNGLGRPFTAIVGAEVRMERLAEQTFAKVHDELRVIVFGEDVTAADFLEHREDGSDRVIPVQELLLALRKKYGRDAVREYSTKGEYICRLYAAMKGAASPVDRKEADSCMRAFVNSIAYRQPEDLDGLIREEILEADDNSAMIETLKTTITDIANLRQQAENLAANVASLEELGLEMAETTKNLMEEWMFSALAAARAVGDATGQRDDEVGKRTAAEAELTKIGQSITMLEGIVRSRGETLQRLMDQLRSSDVYQVRAELDRLIEAHKAEIETFSSGIQNAGMTANGRRAAIAQARAAVASTEGLESAAATLEDLHARLDAIDLHAMQADFQAARDGVGGSAPRDGLVAAIAGLDAAIGAGWANAFGEASTVLLEIEKVRDGLRADWRDLNEKIRELEQRRQDYAAGRVSYPPANEEFVNYLREVLPEAKPRFLCDVVEMRDPAWQNAVEGFIGGDRFAILYEPAYEERVITLLRRFTPRGRGQPSAAQLGEALAESRGVRVAGSLVEKVKSDDPVAMAYLAARYHRSLCVDSEAQLKGARSALLIDGVSVQAFNYRNRAVPDENLVFGKEVRRRMAEALAGRIDTAKNQAAAKTAKEEQLRQAGRLLASASPVNLSSLDVEKFREAASSVRRLTIERDQLDTSDIAEVEAMLLDEQTAIEEAQREVSANVESRGKFQDRLDKAEQLIIELERKIAELEPDAVRTRQDFEDALSEIVALKRPAFEASFREELATDRPIKSFTDRRTERRGLVQTSKVEIDSMVREYNRDAAEHQKVILHQVHYPTPSPSPMAQWLSMMNDQVQRQLRLQRDTGLVENRDNLVVAEQRFTTSFTSNFCARILNKVDGRDETYDLINQALSNISFSGDKLSMSQSVRDDYAPFIELFRAIRDRSNIGAADLFAADAEFTEAQQKTLDSLKLLLLSDDAEHSMKELQRIADHRNYKRYDFVRSSKGGEAKSMSTWGTGSGGEAETPFYIIRAAVFAASFRHYGRQTTSHFRTMLLDEVFQKMDETRTRKVLDFLSRDMGFQVICAAPTKSMAAVMDAFDKRVAFAKSPEPGSQSWIDEIDLNQAKVLELYNAHRQVTIEQTTLDFERDNPSAPDTVAAE